MDILHEKLMTFEKERLVNLIKGLTERLEEEERILFISKYIDSQLALDSVAAEGTMDFLNEIKL